MLPNKRLTMIITLMLAIQGCANTRISPTIEKKVEADKNIADNSIASMRQKSEQFSLVERNDGMWLGTTPIPISKKAPLPDLFSKSVTFERTVNLQEAAERITAMSGMPVKVAKELLTTGTGTGTGAIGVSAVGATPIGMGGTTSAANQNSPFTPVKFNYSGTLGGLLDTVSARFNGHWKYENGRIQLFNLDTRTFVITAIPGDSTLDSKVGNTTTTGSSGSSGGSSSSGSSSSGSSTTGSSQSTTVSSALSVWTGISDSVKTMLSAAGKVNVSPSTGTVTVTDTPEILDRVANFIDDQNRSLGRQVLVNVKILNVSLTDTDEYGLNWNAVYRNVSRSWGFTLKSAIPVSTASTALDLQILSTAGRDSSVYTLAGSDAMINALSTQGKVSLVTSSSTYTLNNQPVPVQVARQTSYLQSVSSTNTANVGSQTTLTPGVFTTGFSMNVLPHILDSGKVLLQFSIDLSTLNILRTVSSGSGASVASIQTPEIDTRNFLQRVSMNNGETLVLSGFEQNTDNLRRNGVISPMNQALGGSTNGTHNRDLIVILITPVASGG